MNHECVNERPDTTPRNNAEQLLEQLLQLLEQQFELIRQGGLSAAEELCEQVDPCIRAIAETHVLNAPHLKERRERLMQLYEELCLTLTAQRDETSRELGAVRQGKRVLRAYGNHTSSR